MHDDHAEEITGLTKWYCICMNVIDLTADVIDLTVCILLVSIDRLVSHLTK